MNERARQKLVEVTAEVQSLHNAIKDVLEAIKVFLRGLSYTRNNEKQYMMISCLMLCYIGIERLNALTSKAKRLRTNLKRRYSNSFPLALAESDPSKRLKALHTSGTAFNWK